MSFTDKQISSLKRRTRRYERPEPGRTGLGIRVAPNGVKTWTLRYRLKGEQRRVILGVYPNMGIAAAHGALAHARQQIEQGVDPGTTAAEIRQAERNAETVADLVNEYLEHHARKKKKPSSAHEDERLLTQNVLPHWEKRKAKEITRRDVIKLLDGIEARGARITRNRVAALISRMFRTGLDRGIIEAHPAVGIERLPETPRDRVLSPEEIRNFWLGLDNADMAEQTRLALKFALVTGQRRSEIAGTTRTEIDDAEALWRLPAARTKTGHKTGRDNVIPLPRFAVEIVAEADALRVRPLPVRPGRKDRKPYSSEPSLWLFASYRHGKPLGGAALTRAINRNRAALGFDGDRPPTVHDLRRTFATYHGELGTAPEILSALLGHSPNTITRRVYDRSTNLGPKRSAMARWCQWLELVIAGKLDEACKMFGAEIVPIEVRHAG